MLSLHCIRIATVNFFQFHSHYGQLHIKSKVNTFAIASKHKVNGMIQAYTSIKPTEHSFFYSMKNGRNALLDVTSPTFYTYFSLPASGLFS